MRMNWLLAAASLTVTAGCAVGATSPSPALPPGSPYVALGSSYAAGAGIGPLQPGSQQRCQRTTNNYASLLARRLQLQLTDVSCGGATTANLLGPSNDLPAQLDAVVASPRLVTVTVGGVTRFVTFGTRAERGHTFSVPHRPMGITGAFVSAARRAAPQRPFNCGS